MHIIWQKQIVKFGGGVVLVKFYISKVSPGIGVESVIKKCWKCWKKVLKVWELVLKVAQKAVESKK